MLVNAKYDLLKMNRFNFDSLDWKLQEDGPKIFQDHVFNPSKDLRLNSF